MLKVDSAEINGVVVLKLVGMIAEDNPFRELARGVSQTRIIIDAARVDRLTSFGVGDFVGWVQGAEKRGNVLYWTRVSTALVAQSRMVRSLLGQRSRVVSVVAPYYCDACDAESTSLVELERFHQTHALEAPACRTCGNPQELDDVEEEYLRFLHELPKEPLEAPIRDLLQRLFQPKRKT